MRLAGVCCPQNYTRPAGRSRYGSMSPDECWGTTGTNSRFVSEENVPVGPR
jgi:hypothetical protein